MKYEAEFKLLLADLKKRYEDANVEYEKCPRGRICQENRSGKLMTFHVYEENGKRKRSVINGETQLMAQLATKRYLEEEIEILTKDIAAIERFVATYIEPTPERIIERLPNKYKAMAEDCFFYRQRWTTEPYEQSTYKPEEKVQVTSRGLKVRTKSEVVLAEMLDAAGITYRYEQMINIEGFSFAPDFTILTKEGIVYWEHAGKIHEEHYRNRHKWKLSMYEKVGIVSWENLIVTYDNAKGGLDTRIIRSEIENKLL